jgi:hypothetical protein
MVADFWNPTELAPFYTAELRRATKAIQEILDDVKKADRCPKQRLSFIVIDRRLLLVWAFDAARRSTRGIGSDANYSKIVKALHLRVTGTSRREGKPKPKPKEKTAVGQ